MMIKNRKRKKDDQENAEEAFQLLKEFIMNHEGFDMAIWVAGCTTLIADRMFHSGLSYGQFCEELDRIKKHYGKNWIKE